MQQAKVYIVIVTYNAMQWIDSCLQSLRQSTIPVKTIVVDNCSNDETVAHVSSEYTEVFLIPQKVNAGFGQANNIGMKRAFEEGADYIYLLNQDAWISPKTIETLVSVMASYPEIGIASPIQLDATSKKVDKLFLKDVLMERETTRKMMDGYITGELKNYYDLWYFPAAHWMISRRCIEEVGLFSPAFFHYGEDNNYIQRVHYHGLRTAIVPAAKAIHDRGERKKLDYIGLAFLQYNNAIIQASNIEVGGTKHMLFLIKFFVISVGYYLFIKFLSLFKELKKHYIKMTPYGMVNNCYRRSKGKGFMLSGRI